MYNLALDPSVLSWCHLDTRAPEAAASLQLPCRPCTHTRHTRAHTQGHHWASLTRVSPVPSTRAHGIPDSWSDCNCWYQTLVQTHSVESPSLKEILKQDRLSWSGAAPAREAGEIPKRKLQLTGLCLFTE